LLSACLCLLSSWFFLPLSALSFLIPSLVVSWHPD
jgi:hypothetical protein